MGFIGLFKSLFWRKRNKMSTDTELNTAPPLPPEAGEPVVSQRNNLERSANTEILPTEKLPESEESFHKEILQELGTLKQAVAMLTQQLNEKERLPANFLGSFQQPVRAGIQGLQQEFSYVKEQLNKLQSETLELTETVKFTSGFVERNEVERVSVLAKEVEKYKNGFLEKFNNKCVNDVVLQIDAANETVARIERKKAELSIDDIIGFAKEIATEFRWMLEDRFGLTAYETDVGSEVNSDRHRVTPRSEPTTDNTLDGKIAKTVVCGYSRRNGDIFRQEDVVIYRYEPAIVQEAVLKTDAETLTDAGVSADDTHKTNMNLSVNDGNH